AGRARRGRLTGQRWRQAWSPHRVGARRTLRARPRSASTRIDALPVAGDRRLVEHMDFAAPLG
ncbi:hypothetical protein ACI6Q5_20610, partial [Xanthomonas codiaei]